VELECVGKITQEVRDILTLNYDVGTLIYIGDSNYKHMMDSHSDDYRRHGKHIVKILEKPDYVRLSQKDGSIGYVKVINEFVQVVVRVAGDGLLYVRSLYVIHPRRVRNMVESGDMKVLI
jgi:hypothetical protein